MIKPVYSILLDAATEVLKKDLRKKLAGGKK